MIQYFLFALTKGNKWHAESKFLRISSGIFQVKKYFALEAFQTHFFQKHAKLCVADEQTE